MSDDLKALAQRATPGPWKHYLADGIVNLTDGGRGFPLDGGPYPDSKTVVSDRREIEDGAPIFPNGDGEYIAAANPDAILELIRERDELKARLAENIKGWAADHCHTKDCAVAWDYERERWYGCDCGRDTMELQALKAKLEAAERERDELRRPGCPCIVVRAPGGFHGEDPPDCNWPNCGCDPHTDRVMGGLRECGWLNAGEATELQQERDAAIQRADEAELERDDLRLCAIQWRECALRAEAKVEKLREALDTALDALNAADDSFSNKRKHGAASAFDPANAAKIRGALGPIKRVLRETGAATAPETPERAP